MKLKELKELTSSTTKWRIYGYQNKYHDYWEGISLDIPSEFLDEELINVEPYQNSLFVCLGDAKENRLERIRAGMNKCYVSPDANRSVVDRMKIATAPQKTPNRRERAVR